MLLTTERNNSCDVIQDACRVVAEHYHGERGLWCYRAFDWINHKLFSGELPLPLLTLGLTAHGACLGWTRTLVDKPPVVLLHPSLWGGTEKEDPWDIPPDLLGPRYALDTLIHEAIHVSVQFRLGGPTLGGKLGGDSSHNNPEWIAEVNRIAPLIDLDGVQAAMSKVVRVGKKIRRVSKGNIPFRAAAGFPRAVRYLWNRLDYYRDRSPLAFDVTDSCT